MKRTISILSFCFLLCAKVIAAPDTGQLLHFDMDDGFPSNNVYSLIQDRLGYLWFATDNGIVKYNGYSFRTFNAANGLPANDVFQLHKDTKGRIWLNSMSYQFGYMQNDKYHDTRLRTRDRMLKVYDFADNGEYVFVIYSEAGMLYLAVLKDDLEYIIPLHFAIATESQNRQSVCKSVCMLTSGKFYIITFDNSVYVYDLRRPHQRPQKICGTMPDYISRYMLGSKLYDDNGHIYIYRHKEQDLLVLDLKHCSTNTLSFANTPGEYIYTAISSDETLDPQGYTQVVTNTALYAMGEGAVRQKDIFSSLINTTSQIAFVFNDELNNKWYTTNSAGVWCKQKEYSIFQRNDSLQELLGTKFVGSSKDGTTFWWDKDKHAFYKLLANGRVKNIYFPFKTGIGGMADYSDTLIYLTLKAGIYQYNKYTDELSDVIDGYKDVTITYEREQKHQVTNDTNESIFLGAHYGMLSYNKERFYTASATGFSIFNAKGDSLVCHVVTDDRLTNILFDTIEHKIITYNQKKIFIFDPLTEKHVAINDEYLKRYGIGNIINIAIDRFHNIYIQDEDRVFVYNPILIVLRELKGNFNFLNATLRLCGDDLLMARRFGIAVADIKGPLSIAAFHTVPNIDNYKRMNDFVVNNYGDLLINTDKGFYKMKIQDIKLNDSFPDPTDPKFFKMVLALPFEKTLQDNDTIIVDQKTEKIKLDAINYYGKGSLNFSYFTEAYSKDWQQSDGEIFVGSFKPAKYYRVTCTVSDDVWRSRKVYFYVYRTPYWWQTTRWQTIFWLSGTVLVITLLVIVILITRAVVTRSDEKKRALTELELKAIYAQINPHFIFNTLNAAQFFINKKRFDDAYLHINKFSRLLRAYLKSSQDRYISLDEEIQMLKNYIELQQVRFEEKFEYRIEVENKIPVSSIKIPSLLLQPLVENAINHGLFHREKDGMLILKFVQGSRSDELICIIEDNGIGREQAELIKKDSTQQKESYGTKLTQQLINIYREYEKMDIYLEYIDKAEPETGTIVKLTIKNVKYVA